MDKTAEKTAYRTMFREYPEIVTIKEVCQMLGLSYKSVHKLIRDGKLQRIPGGRSIKVARITVIEFVLQSAQ